MRVKIEESWNYVLNPFFNQTIFKSLTDNIKKNTEIILFIQRVMKSLMLLICVILII